MNLYNYTFLKPSFNASNTNFGGCNFYVHWTFNVEISTEKNKLVLWLQNFKFNEVINDQLVNKCIPSWVEEGTLTIEIQPPAILLDPDFKKKDQRGRSEFCSIMGNPLLTIGSKNANTGNYSIQYKKKKVSNDSRKRGGSFTASATSINVLRSRIQTSP